MNEHAPHRIVIYTKDLMILTGKSERTCRKIMKTIKAKLGKPPGALLTIHDVCMSMHWSEAEVYRSLD